MKKFALLLISATMLFAGAILPTHHADAQIVRQLTIAAADDTLTNADTATVTLLFDGSFKTAEAWIKEVTGTTGGTIYFQGETLHGSVWEDLDSLTLSDVTTEQFKLFVVPNPRRHKSYRFKYIKSGTGTAEIKAYTLRYTGG